MMGEGAVVTGAAGFAGIHLTKHLLQKGCRVLALLRPASPHNSRVEELAKEFPEGSLRLMVVDRETGCLSERVREEAGAYSVFFDLAWGGGRNDTEEQEKNISRTLDALKAAKILGCRRFVGVGSQAEYGVVQDVISEQSPTMPFSAYGAAKLSACHLSRIRAQQCGMEWIWGRIFSLTGACEPAGRMLPDLKKCLLAGEEAGLSSCRQYWDYLDAGDCAEALIALAQSGHPGEIYNIANGAYRPLREYTEEMKTLFGKDGRIVYGGDPHPFVSLRPSVEKIRRDTGWEAKVSFSESVEKIG